MSKTISSGALLQLYPTDEGFSFILQKKAWNGLVGDEWTREHQANSISQKISLLGGKKVGSIRLDTSAGSKMDLFKF